MIYRQISIIQLEFKLCWNKIQIYVIFLQIQLLILVDVLFDLENIAKTNCVILETKQGLEYGQRQ